MLAEIVLYASVCFAYCVCVSNSAVNNPLHERRHARNRLVTTGQMLLRRKSSLVSLQFGSSGVAGKVEKRRRRLLRRRPNIC